MEKKIKTGVLSYGMSGTLFHCPFLSLHEGFELSGIVERTTKKAVLKYPTIKSYDSVDEMLNDKELELIVVNTPNPTHFEFAMKAIKAGKHVLVEKPFTTISSEAKQLFEAAKKHKCQIFPFQNRRYDSDFLSVKKILASEVLGDLIEVHFRYDRYNSKISDKKIKEMPIVGSSVLYDLGAHVLDAAIDLFGIPSQWSKVKLKNRPNTKIDDYGSFHLQYENGLQVFLTVSLLVADAQKSFVLHGKKGSFVKDRTDIQEAQLKKGMLPNEKGFGVESLNSEGILTTVRDGIVSKEKIVAEPSNYRVVFDAVYDTIRNNKNYPITEGQIVKQIEILEN